MIYTCLVSLNDDVLVTSGVIRQSISRVTKSLMKTIGESSHDKTGENHLKPFAKYLHTAITDGNRFQWIIQVWYLWLRIIALYIWYFCPICIQSESALCLKASLRQFTKRFVVGFGWVTVVFTQSVSIRHWVSGEATKMDSTTTTDHTLLGPLSLKCISLNPSVDR